MIVTDYPPALDTMLKAWNEAIPDAIRGHLDAALATDVHFVDPTANIRGIDAFEAMVHEVQARLPGAVYSRVSDVDAHNELYRYHWAIHVGGNLAVQGLDVTEVSDGRVTRVLGFFGDLPLNRSL